MFSNFQRGFSFLFSLIAFLSLSAQAQPPVISPNNNGTTPVPIQTTNAQLSALLSDGNKDAGADNNAKLANNKVNRDSTNRDNIKQSETTGTKTFGRDALAGASVFDVGEMSTPPLDYPIGVGDNIVVSLWGGAEYQNSYVVARDGSIFPKGLGKIYVQGYTFETARDLIMRRFMSVTPSGTNVAVTLGQNRTINVNVVGNVNSPGPQTVSAFSNGYNVIAAAGGINEYADMRNILIKRNGVVIDSLDVYKYLTEGDVGRHIYLQNNDAVIVGDAQKTVLATGQFKRPMYYQLKKHEGVRALLKYSGGLTADALASTMKILRSENESQVQIDINANAILKLKDQDAPLMDGDIVKVDLIRPGLINKIEVKGEVKYPGTYELRKNDRLFDLINRAGGVTRNTFLGRAYVFRGAGDSTNMRSDRLEVNLNDISDSTGGNTSAYNLKLYANDIVQLFNANDFADPQFVEIYGEVRKEGKIRRYGGMTLEDLLFLAGGLKPTAEYGRLEISSIVDIDSARQGLKPTRTLVKPYAISSELLLDTNANKIILKPYDQVFVRRNPNFELQENIEIKGRIKYPGLYPRLNKFEKLSSFIKRAGGIAENANLSGAVLYRKLLDPTRDRKFKLDQRLDTAAALTIIKDSARSTTVQPDFNEPISIDLYRALKYKNSKYDIILQEGDIIVIPEIDPFVKVTGQVQSPLKISFDKEYTRLPYYIDKAGGYAEKPWRSRIYVKYANGKSRRTRNFGFLHFYPKVEEGSVVNVPMKPKNAEVLEIVKSTFVTAIPIILSALIFKYIKL